MKLCNTIIKSKSRISPRILCALIYDSEEVNGEHEKESIIGVRMG